MKMRALQEFPYRGETLRRDEEFEAESEEQASLLVTIGKAERVTRRARATARTRAAVSQVAAAITTAPPGEHV